MRFLLRGLLGLTFLSIMIGLVGFGGFTLYGEMTAEETLRKRPAGERIYAVNVSKLEPQKIEPLTSAYGEIESWRTLELRASSEGRLVDVAAKFRDGVAVRKGELLLRIDPANAEFQVLDAEAALADAEAQKVEAEEAVVGAEQELEAARRQLDLRRQTLERQRQLKSRGYSTAAQVEAEELAVASLEQSLSNRLQSVISARKRIERMELTVRRAALALKNANRVLGETAVMAPFSGYLSDVNATLGRRVNPSEALAHLIDPTALEVKFSLSTSEFSRLLDGEGKLLKTPVTVTLELGAKAYSVEGKVDRSAAVVSDGEAGRSLFATLNVQPGTVLRPGDFVSVSVQEPELSDVAVVPASAVTEDGRLLVLGDDGRLKEIQATLLRRTGNDVVLAEVPFGVDYVRERLPQLGLGLKVTPRRIGGEAISPSENVQRNVSKRVSPEGENSPEFISLSPEKRDALISQLSGSQMPEERKAKLIALLKKQMVPRELVERLERRGQKG